MKRVLLKSTVAAVASLVATLAICFLFVPLMGGQMAGAGLVMTIVCPVAVGFPASFSHFYQAEKLRQANLALEEAYRRLHEQSRRDALTGVLNRTAFMAELQMRSDAGASGGLLFIDLDHFKSINDSFGHATGDEALSRMGALLGQHACGHDLVGRLGGEEFGVFLHGVSANDMVARSQQLREAVQRLDLRAETGMAITMAASIGACHCLPGFAPSTALATADGNLYRAKSTGRNTVVA